MPAVKTIKVVVGILFSKNNTQILITKRRKNQFMPDYWELPGGKIEKGEDEVVKMMNDKLKNEKEMMVAINAVTAEFGVTMIQPFLLPNFIEYAKKIPISEKIHGQDDMQRKHPIRELAMDYGIPEVAAQKQKKALQYGSQIHKSLLKSRKTS